MEPTPPGKEFATRFTNSLTELQLTVGIYRRIERLMDEWAADHTVVRASYIGREVDSVYFQGGNWPAEALARPKLQGLAIDESHLYEFIAFAHGFKTGVSDTKSIVEIEEIWLEPKVDEPFQYRVMLHHEFGVATVLTSATGEGQDAIRSFVGRFNYLRG